MVGPSLRLRLTGAFLLLLSFGFLPPTSNSADKRDDAKPAVAFDAKLLEHLYTRNLGPARTGGRVVSIAGVETGDSKAVYVAAATGGLWRTDNNGGTWKQCFDSSGTHSMGCVAIARSNPDILWVGTGEVNPRNSCSWGDGVYKSTDAGKTWQHMGLKETQHVAKICIHPENPDIVYVAALGHVWGPNKERGIYKTEDGGKTWELIKFIDENTGFIELVMDPNEPDTLYGGAWSVRRGAVAPAWSCLSEYSATGGIFKTTDAGKTWKQLTQGLPKRPTGRIGMDICRKKPNVVYAVVSTDQTTKGMMGQVANKGAPGHADKGGIFRSTDHGETWTKMNDVCHRPYYFCKLRVDPTDPDRLFYLGLQNYLSVNGGKTFGQGGGGHPDMHALWIDPRDFNRIFLGNDGGVYFSETRSQVWWRRNNFPIGQFYHCDADMSVPYRVYGGLQDNSCWGVPSASRYTNGIVNDDWKNLGGGDGFYCLADPSDPRIVYSEGQWGAAVRHTAGAKGASIKPKTQNGRFNWQTPMALSPHDPKTIYFGGQMLYKSTARGDKWQAISPDLSYGPEANQGNAHTISTICESPVKRDLLYVGTDDGRIHVTRDSGGKWTELSKNIPDLPKERWITRVECSHFDEGTAYVAIDRHRNDDMKPYVFKTTDHGATWKSIVNNLPPMGTVHTVRADSRNPNLLFVGTEYAMFVSVDGGERWHRMSTLPPVPMHHAVIHPRDRDLVIATHGRGIWTVDIAPLQEMTPDLLASDGHLFDIKPAILWKRTQRNTQDQTQYVVPNPPIGSFIHYYLKNPAAEPVAIKVLDADKKVVAQLQGTPQAGLQRVLWTLEILDGPPKMKEPEEDVPPTRIVKRVPPGEYTVQIALAGKTLEKKVRVIADDEKIAQVPMPSPPVRASKQQARLGTRVEKLNATAAAQLGLMKDQGLFIVEVLPNSAADKAGFQNHDILIELGDHPVPADPAGLDKLLEKIMPDISVTAVVLRKGKKVKIEDVILPERGEYAGGEED